MTASATTAAYMYPELDPRWCENGDSRYGEHGVIDAEQADESHLDARFVQEQEDEDDEQDEELTEEEETARLAKSGRIRFSRKKLYGREEELEKLIRLFKTVLQQPPSASDDECDDSASSSNSSDERKVTKTVFISGFSGCGKSALIKTFVENVKSTRRISGAKCHDQVLFLTAKYEKTQSSAPFSAFSTLFDHIPMSLRNEFRRVYSSLEDSLGDDVIILRRIFPQLRYLFSGRSSIAITNGSGGEDDASVHSSSNSASGGGGVQGRASSTSSKTLERRKSRVVTKARRKFAISLLFRALSEHLNNRPLILFVDDLQWADQAGLELLQDLISDETLQYTFFIGSYRSNEIDDNPHFQKMIKNIEGSVPYEDIHLSEISGQATGEFISDTLGLSTEDVTPLTQVVFSKTLGNPLYTRQALEHLVRKNALYYDTVIFSWSWNLGGDSLSGSATTKHLEDLLADDILSMVKSKIENMSNKELKQTLATASFVRASFDSDTLLHVMMSVNERDASQTMEAQYESIGNYSKTSMQAQSKYKLSEALRHAVDEGLLLPLSDPRDNNQTFAFAHDQIQEAAASFIPENNEDRKAFLIKVGLGLLERAESMEEDEDWMYFAAAGHLNSVPSNHVRFDDKFKLRLVELNVHTAQLSLNLLAFDNAVGYVAKGISLLSELSSDIWSAHYDFTLDLHCIGAQAELGEGHMDKADFHCKEVLARKKDIFSALPAYKVHLDVLAGTEDQAGALELNLRVLEELGGVKFPKTARGMKVKAWFTLKQMKASGLPTEEIVSQMPYATDPVAVATMEFIQKAVRFAFANQPDLYTLLCCESIKWMNKYGLTNTSGASTASFANVVCHKFGDFKTGVRLARLAILIVDKQKSKFYETQALNTANNFVLGWVTPIKTRLPYHVRAYQAGITSGNLEGCLVAKWHTFWNLYHSASPLSILEQEQQMMVKKAKKWGYVFFKNFYSIFLQLVLNLVGKSENTTKLIGSAADETEAVWHKMPFKAIKEAFRSQLFVFFGDFEHGAEDALVRGNSYVETVMGMQFGMEPFYRGISLYAMGRKTGDKKYKNGAREVKKLYQVWVKKGCVNLVGLLTLFDAEDYALDEKPSQSCKKYDESIATLIDGGFYGNAGVACERYATYLAELGQPAESRAQLKQAKIHFNRWGAKRKVELLADQLLKTEQS
ncbi:MAG: hypothetical protein SGILL_000659 [Bacillariaceae sp.]